MVARVITRMSRSPYGGWTDVPFVTITVALLMGILLSVVGFVAYTWQSEREYSERLRWMNADAQARSASADHWFAERSRDLIRLSGDPAVIKMARDSSWWSPDQRLSVSVQEGLEEMSLSLGLRSAVVVDETGRVVASDRMGPWRLPVGATLEGVTADLLAQAAGSTEPVATVDRGDRLVGESHTAGQAATVALAQSVFGDDGLRVGFVVMFADPVFQFLPLVDGGIDGGSSAFLVQQAVVRVIDGTLVELGEDPVGQYGFMAVGPNDAAGTSRDTAETWSAWVSGASEQPGSLAVGVWNDNLGLGFISHMQGEDAVGGMRTVFALALGAAWLVVGMGCVTVLAFWWRRQLASSKRESAVLEQRARLQEYLAKAERSDVVGRLAAGIAHDFNNLLGAVVGHIDLATKTHDRCAQARPPDEASESLTGDLAIAREAAVRAGRIVRQLLAIGHGEQLERKPCDLSLLASRVVEMVGPTSDPDVSLELAIDARASWTRADEIALERALINLTLNAFDAVGPTGRVSIGVDDRIVKAPLAAVDAQVPPGRYVVVSVTDDGVGMAPEVLEKAFEPFYTTKGGAGNGLGLAATLGTITQHGGYIVVRSEIGGGTTFDVYLQPDDPASAGPALRAVGLAAAARPIDVDGAHRADPDGRGTDAPLILVVDDEPGVRRVAVRALQLARYEVITAGSPKEARALLLDGREPDLLVSDVVMPGMSGPDLLELLRLERPHLRAVFMSGYAPDGVMDRGVRSEDSWFVAKPFTVDELLGVVSEALGAVPARSG